MHIQHESTVASLKKEHQNATSEMAEQVTKIPALEHKHSPIDILQRLWSSEK